MISFCDELGAPNLGIVMDESWYESVRSELDPWLRERGCAISLSMVLMDTETKTEFLLRWS